MKILAYLALAVCLFLITTSVNDYRNKSTDTSPGRGLFFGIFALLVIIFGVLGGWLLTQ